MREIKKKEPKKFQTIAENIKTTSNDWVEIMCDCPCGRKHKWLVVHIKENCFIQKY